MNTLKEAGLYIHIPYCARKCRYCDFPSWAGKMGTARSYTEALLKEAERKAGDRRISTLFIGGGTPSLMPPALMEALLKGLKSVFPFTPDAECSCEVNPGMLSDRFAETVAENGINRVSMGAQALQDRLLRTLGRLHTVRDVEKSMTRLREHGIRNINLDLMFGLPGQSVPDWRETLEAAFSLEPEHLSCYGLIPEEGTEMKAAIDSGEVTLPSEEEEREMYDIACRLCEEHGFLHYEISNFALPGRECRHNTDCWERREYIGLGCAACGFKDGIRSRNPGTIAGYLAGEAPEEERISPADARFESMMLGLRMMKGVNEGAFQAQHGISMREAFGDRLNLPVKEGLAVFENGYYRLTRRGMDLQNRVLVALMD